MPYLGKLWERSDGVLRVADALDVERLGLFVDGCFERFEIVVVNELDMYAKSLEIDYSRFEDVRWSTMSCLSETRSDVD